MVSVSCWCHQIIRAQFAMSVCSFDIFMVFGVNMLNIHFGKLAGIFYSKQINYWLSQIKLNQMLNSTRDMIKIKSICS